MAWLSTLLLARVAAAVSEPYSVVSVVPAGSLVFLPLPASFPHLGKAHNSGEKSTERRDGWMQGNVSCSRDKA